MSSIKLKPTELPLPPDVKPLSSHDWTVAEVIGIFLLKVAAVTALYMEAITWKDELDRRYESYLIQTGQKLGGTLHGAGERKASEKGANNAAHMPGRPFPSAAANMQATRPVLR